MINILIGKNNSGKSTILDAIYLACKEPLSAALGDFLRQRTRREIGASELFFAYDTGRKVSISLKPKSGGVHTLSFYINKNKTGLGGLGELQAYKVSPGCVISKLGDVGISAYSSPDLRLQGCLLPPLQESLRGYCEGAKIFLSSVRIDELTQELDTVLATIKRDRNLESELKSN